MGTTLNYQSIVNHKNLIGIHHGAEPVGDDETDTATEDRLEAALDELLGPLHPASYIIVTDIAADSWGYAGETQELRHVRARLAG